MNEQFLENSICHVVKMLSNKRLELKPVISVCV